MAYDFNTPQTSNSEERLAFYQVWLRAVTQPKPETFQDLANRPDATLGRAFLWIALVSIVTYIIGVIVNLLVSAIFQTPSIYQQLFSSGSSAFAGIGAMLLPMICGVVITPLLSIAGASISAGLVQLISKMLGGTGTFTKQIYATACYSMPVALIVGTIGSIPFLGACIGILVGIYAMVLLAMAIKGVQGFGWGQAIGTIAILWAGIAIIAGCCAVIVVAGLAAMAPSFRDIFQNIQDQIHLLIV
jgi:hypothetical protein